MSRLEIGSIVRVSNAYYYLTCLAGKIGKIVAYATSGDSIVVQFEDMEGCDGLHSASAGRDRPLDGKQDKWFIHPKHLEVLMKEENKQMTQDTLKSGMTVKLRNGYVYLVVNEGLSREFGFEPFINYKYDLTHISDEDYDIVEVYLFSTPTYGNTTSLDAFLDLDSTGMELLWKRQELPELSSAERVILENLDKRCKWIAKDVDGSLYVYSTKPVKYATHWQNTGLTLVLEAFPKLFTFVKWEDEQPYSIEELLKNC